MAQSSAWRGRWVDITGYYQIGLRPYDPVSGRWLTYDSVWNERDPNYYTFAGGEPIMGFDSDGRLTSQYYGSAPGSQLNLSGSGANAVSSVTGSVDTGETLFGVNTSLNIFNSSGTVLGGGIFSSTGTSLSSETVSTTIDSAAFAYDVVGQSSLKTWTVGIGTFSGNTPGNISLYESGWVNGNGSTKIIGAVGDIAETGGTFLTGAGILYDGYNYEYNGEPGLQFAANTTVSATALGLTYSGLTISGVEAGGPLGVALGGGYLAGSLINHVPGVAATAQSIFRPFTDAQSANIYNNYVSPDSFESHRNSVTVIPQEIEKSVGLIV